MKKLACFLTLLCLNFISVFADTPETTISGLLPEALGINVVSRMVGGKNYHFVTYHDELGNINTKIFDTDFVEVQEDEIPISEPKVISDEVIKAFVKNTTGKQRLSVGISFPTVLYPEHSFVAEGYIDELGKSFIYVDGELIDEFQQELLKKEHDQIQDEYLSELLSVKSATWLELRKKNTNPNFDKAMEIAQNYGKSSFVAEMTENEMIELLENVHGMISSVELYHEPEENLANAMLATNVDPWMFDSGYQGQGIGIYMTETNCPPYNNGVLTTQNYYSFTSTFSEQHPQLVSYVIRTVSPQSFLYCRNGSDLPHITPINELNGVTGKPPIKVINASFSYDTSEYTGETRDWDQFIYDHNVTIVNSAGNTGEASGYVGEPSAALNSITVGNYVMGQTVYVFGNPITLLPSINSTSSYVNPETGNQKPEVVAPGTNLILPNFTSSGNGSYTGTSFSAPHVAAIVADYMSEFNILKDKPHLTKAFILAAATDVVTGDSTKVGEGGVDYLNGYAGINTIWETSPATTTQWNSLDAQDYLPNNGYLDYNFYVHSSKTKVKVAISWVTNGIYTYNHKNATYPIGTDLDMCVYDPNGSLVGCSASRFNNYETITFVPSVTGAYRVRVSKYALRDSSSKLYIGLRASIN